MFKSIIGLNKSNPWVVITTCYVLIKPPPLVRVAPHQLRASPAHINPFLQIFRLQKFRKIPKKN